MRVARWIKVTLLALAVAIGVPGFWLVPASLEVRAVDLPLAWPRAEPLRVAVISDLHVGSPYYGISRLPEIVDSINAAQPDLVCILGDFVTLGVIGGHQVPPEPIAAALRGLRSAYGTYAVLGNHDRRSDGPRVRRALETAGIHVLEDTAVVISTPGGPLWLAGVSDAWTGPHDVRGHSPRSRTTARRCSSSRTIRTCFPRSRRVRSLPWQGTPMAVRCDSR